MVHTTLHIKNMVCPRCISTVRATLEALGLRVNRVALGEADVTGESIDVPLIDERLRANGFALLFEKEELAVVRTKAALLDYLAALERDPRTVNISAYLADHLGMSYASLSKTFSKLEHTTIEKYLIVLKIERVKELLSYGELTLSEIAFRLRYSSVQALSNQFKKITGVSVSDYRHGTPLPRQSLDALRPIQES